MRRMTRDGSVQDAGVQKSRRNSGNVCVRVDGGAVSLSAHVADHPDRELADKAVTRVGGVHAVADGVETDVPLVDGRKDTDIALAVSTALSMNIGIPRDSVHAIARKGWVTLDGTVHRGSQRLAALRSAHDTHGVVGITNHIEVEHRGDEPCTVEHDIDAALYRLADIDAHSVHVAVTHGVATLTGRLSSWQELTAARQTAAVACGIDAVDIKLRVAPAPVDSEGPGHVF